VLRWGRLPASLAKTLMFTILVPGTVGVYIPYRLRPATPHAITAVAALGLLPIAAGFCIYLWCAWDFATFGRGTPLPLDPPKELVVRGLFRYARNPMYVGVLLAIFGQALWFTSAVILGYGLAVAVGFHLMVILYEEPVLRAKFGASYEQYCREVRRWIPTRAAKCAPEK